MEENKKDENEVKDESVEQNKKKKGVPKVLYWLIVIAGCAFIFIGSYQIGYKIGNNFGDKSTGSTKTNSNSNEEQKNVDENVVDEATKSTINDKMAMLFSTEKIENNFIKVTDLSDAWGAIFSGELDETAKRLIIKRGFKTSEYVKYNATNGTFSSADIKENLEVLTDITSISLEKFNAKYKKLFGTEPTSTNDIGDCPALFYDSTNKTYVKLDGCGGINISGQLVYIDAYNKKDNSVVVSTYVGGIATYNDGMDNAESAYVVYGDYYDADNIKNNKIIEKQENFDLIKIDETNKASFTKYNFTFEKASDGEYYFKSVSKAN